MRSMLTRIAACAALAISLLAVPRAHAAAVTFITDFGYNGRHAYFYVALDKGYYKAEGLDVTFLRGQGSADAIRKVGAGVAQIGFADAGSLVLARANDAIPVKLVAIVYATPPHAIFALAESGIKTPKDLGGRTIADSAFSAVPVIFGAYAQAAGIDRGKVKWIAAESASLPSLLATGRVDAIGQFTVGEPLLASRVAPKALVRLAYKDQGLDYYGNGIVASEDTIRTNPEMIKAFLRATAKGMQDAFADPAEAGRIISTYHKEISPKVARQETELVRELALVPGRRLGVIDPARVKSTIDVIAKSYPLKATVAPQDLFVPGFVD